MDEIKVIHNYDDAFVVLIRDHVIHVDQPAPGGADTGPSPVELFVASLAACVAFYARRYLVRHGLPDRGLQVGTSYAMSADRPTRVASVDLRIETPIRLPAHRVRGLMAVVERCTVHNSIRQEPQVRIGLTAAEEAA